jgi:hypothetical protein
MEAAVAAQHTSGAGPHLFSFAVSCAVQIKNRTPRADNKIPWEMAFGSPPPNTSFLPMDALFTRLYPLFLVAKIVYAMNCVLISASLTVQNNHSLCFVLSQSRLLFGVLLMCLYIRLNFLFVLLHFHPHNHLPSRLLEIQVVVVHTSDLLILILLLW